MHNFYKTIFAHVSIPAAILDSGGLFAEVNAHFCRFIGAPDYVLLEKKQFLDYIHADEREQIRALFSDVQRGVQSEPFPVSVRLSDEIGNSKIVNLSFKKTENSEQVMLLLISGDNQNHGEALAKAAEMEDLFYLLSHNLKSPIVAIQGFIDLLIESSAALPEWERVHYLKRIKKNVSYLSEMVRNILEFSKAARTGNTFETVVLQEMLENLRAEFYFRLKQSGIHLRLPKEMPVVTASAQGLRTVFTNLIENAIKYIGEVAAPCIEIGWEDKGRFHVFWIKDNGMGLSEEYHEKVFNLFERASAPRDIEGTGIGLAIVKRIVESHGGLVRLSSKIGKGATVYFTLPKIKSAKKN